MIFASDNWAGVHPAIIESMTKHSTGKVSGYGAGELDKKVAAQLGEIFEKEVSVFYVATGTAANSIALAASAKPGSVAFCHREAHVNVDECGGPEFFSSARLCGVAGKNGKMDIDELENAISRYPRSFVHHGRPGAITLTQATELGTLYSIEEIAAISAIAREHEIPLHMDGARFANAVVSLGVTPAELTWKNGVDYLSFGATKNGCWCAEALICFDPKMHEEISFHHKRAGQLFSKSRFVSAQFEAYLQDGLWLKMAGHANMMTASISKALRNSNQINLMFEPQANESFVVMKKSHAEKLREKGVVFYEWPSILDHTGRVEEDECIYRFVTSFATSQEEVDGFKSLI